MQKQLTFSEVQPVACRVVGPPPTPDGIPRRSSSVKRRNVVLLTKSFRETAIRFIPAIKSRNGVGTQGPVRGNYWLPSVMLNVVSQS
jgi:hypothetical protein